MRELGYETELSAIAKSNEQCPVDFEKAWQWVGYSTKGNALRVLQENFEETVDFCLLKMINKKEGRGGHNEKAYFLTADCFKAFCMMAGTDRGKEVRRYFLQIEKAYIELLKRWRAEYEAYEAFRLMDKEHQKAAMKRLNDSLRSPVKVDYIKANAIADKAASTLHVRPKLVKKAAMDEGMSRDREAILNDTVELMAVNERFGLGLSVSAAVYRKYAPVKTA